MKIEDLLIRFCVFWIILQPWYTLILNHLVIDYATSFVDTIDIVEMSKYLIDWNLLKDYIENVYVVSESESCGKTSKEVDFVISQNKLMRFCFEYYQRANYINATLVQDENKSEFQSCEYKGVTVLSKKKMCPITEILFSSQDFIEGYESVSGFLYNNNRLFFKRQDSEQQPLVDIFTKHQEPLNSLQKRTNVTYRVQDFCNLKYDQTRCYHDKVKQEQVIWFSIEQRYSQIKQECENDILSFDKVKRPIFVLKEAHPVLITTVLFVDIILLFFVQVMTCVLLSQDKKESTFCYIILSISIIIFLSWIYFSYISDVYHIHIFDQVGLDKDCFQNSSIPQKIFEYHMKLDIYFYLYFVLAFLTTIMFAICVIYQFLKQTCVKITKNKRYVDLQEEQDIQNVIEIKQIQANENNS